MKPSPSSSIFRKALLSPFLFVILACIFFLTLFSTKDFGYIFCARDSHYSPSNQVISNIGKTRKKFPLPIKEDEKGCDVFTGKWVHDDGRPLYIEQECPYLKPYYVCQTNGRPDKNYQYWRWQPRDCSLPSFNSTLMLESLRGKTLMFVGDSINRNQYFSLVCLLQRIIPESAKSIKISFYSRSVFTAKEYNATIQFYWSPFLLQHLDADKNVKLVRTGSINEHGKHWRQADIIVFNTYLWWKELVKIFRGSFDDEVKDIVEIPISDAYRLAISDLTQWINQNINPEKTRVFFNTMSPTHKSSKDWGGDTHGSCYNETTLAENITNVIPEKSFMRVITEEFTKSKVPITILNITYLSSYRKDAHASMYGFRFKPLTREQLANPVQSADCIHWCLPGLPDVWNELLFSKIFYS